MQKKAVTMKVGTVFTCRQEWRYSDWEGAWKGLEGAGTDLSLDLVRVYTKVHCMIIQLYILDSSTFLSVLYFTMKMI